MTVTSAMFEEPIDILLIGLGSIGTVYGYMLEKVDHHHEEGVLGA